MNLDAWIIQPAAFWSSLAYLIPIILLNRKLKEKTPLTKLWNLSLVVLTLSSMFCHASFLNLSVAMDFSSIGIIMGFFPLVRFTKGKNLGPALLFLFLLQVGMNYALVGKWPKIALSIVIFLFALTEVVGSFGKNFLKARSLQLSLLLLNGSFLIFLLDDQKIFFCDESGWFAGHTLWHFGTAFSAFFYAKWRFIDERI